METIFPALLRRVNDIAYQRERILTPDDDFLDLDWLSKTQKTRDLPMTEALHRAYMRVWPGPSPQRYDVVTWNFAVAVRCEQTAPLLSQWEQTSCKRCKARDEAAFDTLHLIGLASEAISR